MNVNTTIFAYFEQEHDNMRLMGYIGNLHGTFDRHESFDWRYVHQILMA